VVAPATIGCEATLSKIELRIGTKVKFRLGKQSRTLEPKEKWALKAGYSTAVYNALRAARERGKSVSARSSFKLDGKTVTKKVALR
jgi:hypothetical protein